MYVYVSDDLAIIVFFFLLCILQRLDFLMEAHRVLCWKLALYIRELIK